MHQDYKKDQKVIKNQKFGHLITLNILDSLSTIKKIFKHLILSLTNKKKQKNFYKYQCYSSIFMLTRISSIKIKISLSYKYGASSDISRICSKWHIAVLF